MPEHRTADIRKGAGPFIRCRRKLQNAEPLLFGKGQGLVRERNQVLSNPDRAWPGPRPRDVPAPEGNGRRETPASREAGANGPLERGVAPLGGFSGRRRGALAGGGANAGSDRRLIPAARRGAESGARGRGLALRLGRWRMRLERGSAP